MVEEHEQQLELKIPALRVGLWLLIVIIALLAVLPSIFLLLWAFAGTETVGLLSPHTSLHWFKQILSDSEWRDAITYSVILGIITSLVGCITLLIHFYFMRYAPSIFDRVAYINILLLVLIPSVTYALALRILGGALRIPESALLLAGHLIFVIPLQFFMLESKQDSVPTNLLFAGSTLGASHFKNITFVYLPLMKDALWNALVVGFFLSFDELVVATFVIDSPAVTVPRRLWDQVNTNMEPSPAVISCLIVGVYLITLAATYALKEVRGLLRVRNR